MVDQVLERLRGLVNPDDQSVGEAAAVLSLAQLVALIGQLEQKLAALETGYKDYVRDIIFKAQLASALGRGLPSGMGDFYDATIASAHIDFKEEQTRIGCLLKLVREVLAERRKHGD